MTRSRRPLCGHHDDDPLYVTWVDPDYEPQNRATVDAALAHLAEVLNTLPSPVDGAIADLTTRDIATLLSRAPLDRRKHALGTVGIPVAPRTVGQALCSDVRARLDRVHMHDVIHCATVLAQSAYRDLSDFAAGRRGTDGDTPDPTAQWTEATLRFALWTGVRASPADARVLVWAATQPWFLPRTLSEAHGKEVLDAARAVIEATPDFTADDTEDRVTGPATAVAHTDHPDPADADTDTAAGVPSESEDDVQVPTTAADRLDDLRAERTNLEPALTSARAAAHQLVETIDVGELPAATDIDAIIALRDALQRLAAALPLEAAAAPSVTTIDAALATLEQQASRSSVRVRLEALRTLDGGPALAGPLAALRNLADDTLARLADADVADTVAGLTALADLIDLIATDGPTHPDPQWLMDLQMRCAAVLPPQLALLPVAALTGQLSWAPAPTETTGTTADHDTDPATAPDTTDVGPKPTAAVPDPRGLGDAFGTTDEPRAPDSARSETDTDDAAARPAAALTDPAPQVTTAAATAAPSDLPPTPSVMSVPTAPTTAAPEPPSPGIDANAVATVSDLIVTRRFGLAAALAEQAGTAEPRPTVLRLSALADAVRGETGSCASRLTARAADPRRRPASRRRGRAEPRRSGADPGRPRHRRARRWRAADDAVGPPRAQPGDDRRAGRSARPAGRAHRQPASHCARRRR